MAHWETRDSEWVRMMHEFRVPDSTGIIGRFEATGDLRFLFLFLDHLKSGAQVVPKPEQTLESEGKGLPVRWEPSLRKGKGWQ